MTNAVFLAGPEPPGARAVVMMRREPPSGVPDVMAVPPGDGTASTREEAGPLRSTGEAPAREDA